LSHSERLFCGGEERGVASTSKLDGSLEVAHRTFQLPGRKKCLSTVLSHHRLPDRTGALLDEHVVLAHRASSVA